MPSVKQTIQASSLKKSAKNNSKASAALKINLKNKKQNDQNKSPHKRRPGREKFERETIQEVSMQADPNTKNKVSSVDEADHEMQHDPTHSASDASETKAEVKKVEISFPGSELLRAKLPKPFAIAEAVATEWLNNGDFKDIKIENPTAQALAQQGLQKAKEVEQKIIDSGVIEKVATQALTYGMKAQTEINNIREQVKAKLGKK